MPNFANPQSLNRYSYVQNNPIRYTDPTGHYIPCEPGEGCSGNVYPTPNPGGGGGGGGDEDGEDDLGLGNNTTCSMDPQACRAETLDNFTVVTNVDFRCFTNPSSCGVGIPQNQSEDDGSPLVSVAGILLLVNLGALDLALGYGIIAAPSAGPLGLAAELILIPLEVISLDLTVYAAQMAASGSTDHDPLLLIHGFVPDFLPYEP